MAEELDFSPTARKGAQPTTYKDAKEGYNIGDEKTFTDGSQRVLSYAPTSGLRRWLGTGQQEKKEDGAGQQSAIDNGAPNTEFQYPKEIIKPEWIKYNAYLTEDNPFLFSKTYDEVISIWFRMAYNLDNKISIIEEELFMLDGIKSVDYEERKKDLKFQLEQISEKYKTLDNQCLAYLMYKINVVIVDIERFDSNFEYEGWIDKGRTWNEMYDYLEQVQQPDYFANQQQGDD